MNLYYLNNRVNALASKKNRTQSEQLTLCELLQDADERGLLIRYDRLTQKYIISVGGADNE